jgi:hypothetical protein
MEDTDTHPQSRPITLTALSRGISNLLDPHLPIMLIYDIQCRLKICPALLSRNLRIIRRTPKLASRRAPRRTIDVLQNTLCGLLRGDDLEIR